MPKAKKPSPISVRPGKDRGARIAAYAQEHGMSHGAALLALADIGLKHVTLPTLLAHAEAKAAHLGLRKPARRWSLNGPAR